MPVGSINRATLAISDRLRAGCSADELKEIEAWVTRYRAVDNLKCKHAALTLPEQMAAAMNWFEEANVKEAAQVADDVLTTMAALRKKLAKRGLL